MSAGVLARRQVPPVARAVHRAGARRRRGIDRRLRPPPARRRDSRLRGRPVRRRRLRGRSGADLGRRRVSRASTRSSRSTAASFGARSRRRGNAGGARESGATAGGSFSFRNGMQTLTDALARAVGRVTTRRATSSESARSPTADGSLTGTRDGEPFVRRAKSVVLAVPAYVAANARARARAGCGAGRSPRSRTRRSRSSRPPIDVPTSRIRSRVSASSSRSASSERSWARSSRAACSKAARPPSTVLLTSFVGGMRHPELPGAADAELAAIVQASSRRSSAPAATGMDRDHALDPCDSAIQSRPSRAAAHRGGRRARAARPRVLRQLSRRRLGRRSHPGGARDGGRPSRVLSGAAVSRASPRPAT